MPVPHNENAQLFYVNPTMSDGSNLAQLPVPGTDLVSDNPAVIAGVFNAGDRLCFAKRIITGPLSANITITVNGQSVVHPVAFDGPPEPTVASIAVVNSGTGNL